MPDQVLEVFDLIREYAERHDWLPIGWRTFTVGDWRVTVNGTKEERDSIPPFHALVEHSRYVSLMLFSPFGGDSLGWSGAEVEFCTAMQTALGKEKPVDEGDARSAS